MSEHKDKKPRMERLDKQKQLDENAADLEKLKNMKMPMRRVRMLMVNPADFMYLFTKGLVLRKHTKILEGLPEDATLIAIAADSIRNGIMLVVESSTFEEIPINVQPPIVPVKIEIGIPGATKKKKVARKKK